MVIEPKKVRVVIADDSLVAREMLAQILSTDPAIEVVGQAKDGEEAVDMVGRLRPDLITMDIHMPRLDGLKATEKIMAFTPTPILVVSSSVHGEGMGRAFDALNLGALEVIKKPEPKDWAELDTIGREVIRKVKVLANVRVITHIRGRRDRAVSEGPVPVVAGSRGRSLVAIGSSTGGPSALLSVLGGLPADFPVPVVIAQHIAEGFIPGLVSWLDSGCKLKVVAAQDGQRIEPGTAYFAPTGMSVDHHVHARGRKVFFGGPAHGAATVRHPRGDDRAGGHADGFHGEPAPDAGQPGGLADRWRAGGPAGDRVVQVPGSPRTARQHARRGHAGRNRDPAVPV